MNPTVNPADPRLEQMRQALLGGQRTLTGLQAAQAPQAQATNAAVMQTNNPAQSGDSGVQAFNGAIQGLLQKYQQMGTKPFVSQGLDAQQEQNNRILQQTPSSMAGAAPSQRNSVRSGQAQALDPVIQGAHSAAQTYGEQLNSYGNILNNAISFSKNYESSQKAAKDDARAIIHDAVDAGSEAVQALIQAQPDILKTAGYNADTLQGIVSALKRSEIENKKSFNTVDLGDRVGFYDNSGKLIKTEPKGLTPTQGDKQGDADKAKTNLMNLLGQYRAELSKSTVFTRLGDPETVTKLNSLKGQITAEYKKQQQLGTLDAGVQKLIDSIIPGGGFNLSQLSTKAQLDAVDNFITNQGGSTNATAADDILKKYGIK